MDQGRYDQKGIAQEDFKNKTQKYISVLLLHMKEILCIYKYSLDCLAQVRIHSPVCAALLSIIVNTHFNFLQLSILML